MNVEDVDVFVNYDREVVQMICEKYGLASMDALDALLSSEACRMLRDPELEMFDIPPIGIFDMWEVERVTGDPRNSLYIGRDSRV